MNFTSYMFGTRDAMVNLLHNAYNLQSMLRTLDINKYFEKQFKYQIQSVFFCKLPLLKSTKISLHCFYFTIDIVKCTRQLNMFTINVCSVILSGELLKLSPIKHNQW